jgi:glycosyltransferase involved in cell wall biosynthesis
MVGKISVVINTYNEELNIERAIKSVSWADEILVCDMHSDDSTALIARKLGAIVFFHKRTGFVEPARNFAISKAAHEWVLILDADEEIPDSLEGKLKEIIAHPGVTTYVEIPRKNIIFNKWMKASQWWPDYNIRFFKKDKVIWGNKIHRPPKTEGQGIRLPEDERWAIVHHNYKTISQFIQRMNRYTDVQARELKQNNNEFNWADLITKPLNEFLGRFFANQGYKDGLHGLSLSLLQAFSEVLVYLKLWEQKEFKEEDIKLENLRQISKDAGKDIDYWFKYGNLSKNPLKRFFQRAQNKVSQ